MTWTSERMVVHHNGVFFIIHVVPVCPVVVQQEGQDETSNTSLDNIMPSLNLWVYTAQLALTQVALFPYTISKLTKHTVLKTTAIHVAGIILQTEHNINHLLITLMLL